MPWGIVALTKEGLELAKEIKSKFPEAVIHALSKWNYEEGEAFNGSLEDIIIKREAHGKGISSNLHR